MLDWTKTISIFCGISGQYRVNLHLFDRKITLEMNNIDSSLVTRHNIFFERTRCSIIEVKAQLIFSDKKQFTRIFILLSHKFSSGEGSSLKISLSIGNIDFNFHSIWTIFRMNDRWENFSIYRMMCDYFSTSTYKISDP